MLFFIVGASGSGKTACISHLKAIMLNACVQDFDDMGVPENAGTAWRQEATEKWLKKYLEESHLYDSYCICGQAVLGEILACPSRSKISNINICVLDVSDIERVKRLQSRETYGPDQNMLNWAAWLRMHHHDPQWEQQVIKNNAWAGLNFESWDKHKQWDDFVNTTTIDTTTLTINEVAQAVNSWVTRTVYSDKLVRIKFESIFAVIYRGYVKEGMEDTYKDYWNTVASFFINCRGAIGACLHKTEDGLWIAYSKWPCKEMRDSAWPEGESVNPSFPSEIKSAILGLKHCLDEEKYFPEITMEVVDDLM